MGVNSGFEGLTQGCFGDQVRKEARTACVTY